MAPPSRTSATLTVLFVLALALLCACNRPTHTPHAVDGEMDLSGWSPSEGPVNLDGSWHVYWEQLLRPVALGEHAPDGGNLVIPGGFLDEGARGEGYATLRLVVRGLDDGQPLALRIAGVSSAYRLWANGMLVAKSGRVGTSRDTTEPREVTRIARVQPREGQLDLVMHVANFEGGRSGVYKPIVLGEAGALERRQAWLEAVDVALFGALLLLGLYHVGLFFLRRKERGALYIAAICLLWGIRIPLAGMSGRVWWPLAELLPWSVACKAESLALYFAVASVLPLVAHLYPRWHSAAVAKATLAAAGLASLATLLIPTPSVAVASVWNGVAGALCLYSVALAFRQILDDRRASTVFSSMGFLLLATVGVHDMLLDVGLIDAEFLMPLGVVGFVLLQSIGVASRLYKVLASAEAMSEQLEATNLELRRQNALEEELHRTRLHALESRLEAERSRLECLRYQLSPHFLLNAMAAIRGAINQDPGKARRAVSALAEFCRLTLQNAPRRTVSVRDEVDTIRAFLDVHETRFGDDLDVALEVDQRIAGSVVPAWLLQPLVENAIKHGRRTSPAPLRVRVVGFEGEGGELVFRVSNTGAFPPKGEDRGAGGVGVSNLKQRLKRWYPQHHELVLRSDDGWVHAELIVHDLRAQHQPTAQARPPALDETRAVP